MKNLFYPKLALLGMRKNKKMYLPFILTSAGMAMMYYIVLFLSLDPAISIINGGTMLQSIIAFGGWVIALFSLVFLFYTHSFLIRRRKREFGLYNVLGMSKRNIGMILFFEGLFTYLLSVVSGLVLGIAFSKLAQLGLVNMVDGDVNFDFTVSFRALSFTAVAFAVIFLLIFINSLAQIRFANASALLKSENAGEKPPKANFLLGILGFVIVGVAYYIAVNITDPMAALNMFFVAVLMVIVGTYMIMISGSVLVCRILRSDKSYYYKSNHFVSVSSMAYRMKRCGAGLASICILATMVLVTISSTASLFYGSDDALKARYIREINIETEISGSAKAVGEKISELYEKSREQVLKQGGEVENLYEWRSIPLYCSLNENGFSFSDEYGKTQPGMLYAAYIIPLSDYNRISGKSEVLTFDGAMMYLSGNQKELPDKIELENGLNFKIKTSGEIKKLSGSMVSFVRQVVAIVVSDDMWSKAVDSYSAPVRWTCCFDTLLDKNDQELCAKEIDKTIISLASADVSFEGETVGKTGDSGSFVNENSKNNASAVMVSSVVDSRFTESRDYFSCFGGMFYIAIVLSLVFTIAAVLMIYYKQISEGYEDQSRFEIMQKVGMTEREIRKSINSQLLTVFFLPLVFAGIHLVFAFHMIKLLLLLFGLNNTFLFAEVTVICFAVFAIFYTAVYKQTSRAYLKIISGTGRD